MISKRHPILVPLTTTLLLIVAALVWNLVEWIHADRLMSAVAATTDGAAKRHYAVTLDFAPEAFHVTRLQAIGRVIEVKGPTIYMMEVSPAALRTFARSYWVAEVASWPGR